MNEVLAFLMSSSDEQFKRQIQYILDQLNQQNPTDTNNETSSLNPNENEEDDFENEDEEEEESDGGESDGEDVIEEDEGEFNDIIDE